jgi:hypothetical protein
MRRNSSAVIAIGCVYSRGWSSAQGKFIIGVFHLMCSGSHLFRLKEDMSDVGIEDFLRTLSNQGAKEAFQFLDIRGLGILTALGVGKD